MNIQFEHLSQINIDEIIELNTNERVLKQMPLAEGGIFDEKACVAWVKGKEQQWIENGYGPWAIMINEKFAGWGGLQNEEGDADLALVLHPQYWGFGKQIFDEIVDKAFSEMGFESITILLPPSRTKLKGIYALGFEQDGEMTYDGVRFNRYRLKNRMLEPEMCKIMHLIEIEPYHWELYKDDEHLYLNVIINLSMVTYDKTVILDKDAKQAYNARGKDFIQQLAKQIESSQFRKDYDRFYSYPEATKEQKDQMLKAFKLSFPNKYLNE